MCILSLGSDCEHGLKPRFTAIEGDVIFEGEWPTEAILCFIVVVDEKPAELVLDPSLLKGFFQVPENLLKAGIDSVHFSIDMNPGEYNWIFVAILDSTALKDPENGLGWRNLASEFRDPQVPEQLGSVLIGEDDRPYIKMVVDFATPYQGVGNPGYFHLEGK